MKEIYKKIRRAYKEKKELFEEIHYQQDLITYGISDRTIGIITSVLCCLPKKIRDYILYNDVPFYEIEKMDKGLCCPFYFQINYHTKDLIGDKHEFSELRYGMPFIILNLSGCKSDIERFITIAHEIAHTYLGHWHKEKSGIAKSMKENIFLFEKQADDLIEKWGFNRAYKSYKIRRK